ncbi:amino acid permease [Agrobacterium vitis]|uniref:APC family permease n=1 Tax=Agrobacterium vitis TaxID=373 RepID=A0A368NKX1_AGRVI|nr:APC family permease [Agrobacterium vitis]KAA3507776.1 APC family permease [Agrobacterium vitis]KAA3522247.1 APC family permease [Agrobacterium vitis]MUZ75764.1 amino acid permease [Agrobacterium vitis]MUZ98903.1 amino acid permease [Agrobacterium vitis]MVA32695.1 amino acid permease [Agrobacterium vitis]
MSTIELGEAGTELRRNAIGVSHIVFFVVAAAAPLTAVVGASPAAFAFGNGAGVPATYLLVGALYLVFSVGFTAMSRFIGSAGGFYPYIAAGLGRPAGVAGAFVALATYVAIELAVCGLFGFFMNDIVKTSGGPSIAWWIYACTLAALIYACGRRNIEFSGRVLGYCMIAEIAILALFALSVLISGGGPEGITVAPFGLSAVAGPGIGVSLVFVVASFIGFEATAIFGEEARDPKRTIARATYLAVIIIAVFYAFVTWAVALHYGPSNIASEATANTATLYLTAVQAMLGGPAGIVLNALLITSLFACALSFHNTINRYFYSLGREGIAWTGFARTHGTHHSPHMAGGVQTILMVALILAFAFTGQDPYAVVFAWMGAFASVGILLLQTMVCLAVIGFFRTDTRGVGVWQWIVAPIISMAGLLACLALMIINLPLISGSQSPIVASFPVILAIIAAAGATFAVWLKARKPAIYANLGRAFA